MAPIHALSYIRTAARNVKITFQNLRGASPQHGLNYRVAGFSVDPNFQHRVAFSTNFAKRTDFGYMTKVSLIVGASGQTGALLAQYLLGRGHAVICASRNVILTDWWRLERLGIADLVKRVSIPPNELATVLDAVALYEPDEIYFLAGPSSVGESFSKPFDSLTSISTGALTYLEALRLLGSSAHFFNAASTDCFGNQPGVRFDEESVMAPVSPYGVAKATSFQQTMIFREVFGLNACNGILSNLESSFRDHRFVTKKIVSTLKAKAAGIPMRLVLGNTEIRRDWVWAPDAVRAIHSICAAPTPRDYVVATGQSFSLDEFVEETCRQLGLDSQQAYEVDQALFRPFEISSIETSPKKISAQLGWTPTADFETLVSNLIAGR